MISIDLSDFQEEIRKITYDELKTVISEARSINDEPEYLSIKKLEDEWDFTVTQARKYFKEFYNEILKPDSKIPIDCVIEHNNQCRWVHKEAFTWFMQNFNQLKDRTRRTKLEEFKGDD